MIITKKSLIEWFLAGKVDLVIRHTLDGETYDLQLSASEIREILRALRGTD